MAPFFKLILPTSIICGLLGWVLADPYGIFHTTDTLQTSEWRLLAIGAVIAGTVVGGVSALIFAILGSLVAGRIPTSGHTKRECASWTTSIARIFGSSMIVLAIALAVFSSISTVTGSTRSEGFGSPPIFKRLYSYTQGYGRSPVGYSIDWIAVVSASMFPSLMAFIGGYAKQKYS